MHVSLDQNYFTMLNNIYGQSIQETLNSSGIIKTSTSFLGLRRKVSLNVKEAVDKLIEVYNKNITSLVNEIINNNKKVMENNVNVVDSEKNTEDAENNQVVVDDSSPTVTKFMEIFEEMQKNVPDSTSTIEEKELAISYIDKMLVSDDIPSDKKVYWQNKKEIIEQEILAIKNSDKSSNVSTEEEAGVAEKANDVIREFTRFEMRYRRYEDNSNLSEADNEEYNSTYTRVALSYIDRILNCPDITVMQKAKYENLYNELTKKQVEEE